MKFFYQKQFDFGWRFFGLTAMLIFVLQTYAQTLVPKIEAFQTTEAIKVDGVLDEAAWANAEAIKDFRQQEPKEGELSSEKTEIRVLFDDKNLYFAIRAFDSEPSKINARELVRDANFSNDDKVEILLDTYHDKRNAFRFAVNPLGSVPGRDDASASPMNRT